MGVWVWGVGGGRVGEHGSEGEEEGGGGGGEIKGEGGL